MAAPGRRKRPSDRLNRTVSRLWAMRRAAGLEPVVYVKFWVRGRRTVRLRVVAMARKNGR